MFLTFLRSSSNLELTVALNLISHFRCTAFGLLTGIGSMASFCGIEAFAQFVLASCTVPTISIAVLLAVGGLLGMLLPDSCRMNLA